MKSWILCELDKSQRPVLFALAQLYANAKAKLLKKKRNEIRPSNEVWQIAAISTNCQTSECLRFVTVTNHILLSDFRIINVLVLPTNQKPLPQRTQVTRSALSPFTSLKSCLVTVATSYGFIIRI